MSLKSITDKAKHMIIDDDPEPVKEPAKVSSKQSVPTIPSMKITTIASPFSIPTAIVVDESVYQSILAKTDFNNTEVSKIIQSYFDGLDGTGLDESTRLKAALSQASKLDGIDLTKIMTTFDDLKTALQKEVDGFAKLAKANENETIVTRHNRLAEIDESISQLSQEKMQVQSELSKASASHSNATEQFKCSSNT
jgi:hypothetical protein